MDIIKKKHNVHKAGEPQRNQNLFQPASLIVDLNENIPGTLPYRQKNKFKISPSLFPLHI